MIRSRAVATAAVSVVALVLSACEPPSPPPPMAPPPPPPPPSLVRQSVSERTLLTVADDLAFLTGGYSLSREGRADLNHIVPDLQWLQNGKVVVYGYTDNVPVGPELQRQGIGDNLDLSSKPERKMYSPTRMPGECGRSRFRDTLSAGFSRICSYSISLTQPYTRRGVPVT